LAELAHHKQTRRQVVPGVDVVPVPTPTLPPATHTNIWVLGQEEVVVVDPACPWEPGQQAIADFLADRTVVGILLTHHHDDHTGGVADLAARTGAPIWAHPWTAAHVDVDVDRSLDEGDVLPIDGRNWQVFHTPGHAPGHLVLWDPESRTLVAGDMVAGEGTILLAPPEGDLGAYLHHLGRLRDLGPACLLPAHGPEIHASSAPIDAPDNADATSWLQHYIDHRHMRTAQVLDGLKAHGGWATPLDLVAGIYGGLIPEAVYPLAAMQVSCHLDWLVDQGEAQAHGHTFRA
jgi:glyoxylase-like metal-dependent hydrolase (beta-lactamase superfamily II)